jgi:hypothetical protein
MMLSVPRIKLPSDAGGIFVFICIAALVTLAAMMFVFSYLTLAVIADGAKCVGRAWVAGYVSDPLQVWLLPVTGLATAVTVAILSQTRKRQELLTIYDRTILRIASIRITIGTLMVYGALVFCVAGSVDMTRLAAMRYGAISDYCRRVPTPNYLGGPAKDDQLRDNR